MSTLAAIRAAIVAKLSGVAAIGVVHAFERYAKSEGEFRDFYVSEIAGQKLIRGWYVRRMGTREVSAIPGLSTRITTWRLVGFHGLDDATESELVLDELTESVCDAFRIDPTLGGVVADLCDLTSSAEDKQQGIQVEDFAQVLLSQKLCHRVQLSLVTSNPLQF